MIKNNIVQLVKFFYLLQVFGKGAITQVRNTLTYFYTYVYGVNEDIHIKPIDLDRFSAEVSNLESTFTFPDLDFHYIIATDRKTCRSCGNSLTVEKSYKKVIVYDCNIGTRLGRRFNKRCRRCNICENGTFFTKAGTRLLDMDSVLSSAVMLSTEDTAFTLKTLTSYEQELVIGVIPFLTKCRIYNAIFKYKYNPERPLKKKRCMELNGEILRGPLDRRRLEDGFILYAVAKVGIKYGIAIEADVTNRNVLLKSIVETFYEKFTEKWSKHRCQIPGCGKVLVLDGNMKNCRQVCSCKNVTTFTFNSLGGEITTGCLQTPAKGKRLCSDHINAVVFKDDSELLAGETNTREKKSDSDDEVLMIVKILETRETRSNSFLKVLWNDGKESWVLKKNIPLGILEQLKTKYSISYTEEVTFGQKRKVQSISKQTYDKENSKIELDIMKNSVGFSEYSESDNLVPDIENGILRKLKCSTEKSKQVALNRKTAGVLALVSPCGIVVNLKELYNSESKSQVYGHLHDTLSSPNFNSIECICYDDACHLKKYSMNPIRKDLTEVSKRLAQLEFMIDRFHFSNHVDGWCKKNCNPYNSKFLNNVNTEVCEQLFSWFSSFGKMSRRMNRYHFIFLMLYLLDQHNENILENNVNNEDELS